MLNTLYFYMLCTISSIMYLLCIYPIIYLRYLLKMLFLYQETGFWYTLKSGFIGSYTYIDFFKFCLLDVGLQLLVDCSDSQLSQSIILSILSIILSVFGLYFYFYFCLLLLFLLLLGLSDYLCLCFQLTIILLYSSCTLYDSSSSSYEHIIYCDGIQETGIFLYFNYYIIDTFYSCFIVLFLSSFTDSIFIF